MPFYTKKPIPIEARLITEDNIGELAAWSDTEIDINDLTGERSLLIYTLEGVMTARLGEYLIKGIRGEFYPCKPDIFHDSYEEYEEKEELRSWHIEVLDIQDLPDGSAIVNFDIGREAMKRFAEVGLLKVLTDHARKITTENEEFNDKDVGC